MSTESHKTGEAITPAIPTPRPIADFDDSALRDSVQKALKDLEGVAPGHGNAFLDVDRNGAGVMAVHRFKDGWALMGGVKYDFVDRGVKVSIRASW